MEEKRIDETTSSLSRRDFLVKAGALTAGMAAAGGLVGTYMGNATAAPISGPIAYEKLDVEAVRWYAFEGYKSGNGCCYGAAHGLLQVLKSQKAHDVNWNDFDSSLFYYGLGGVTGWGTLCGALTGALYIMSLAVGWKDTKFVTGDKGKTMGKYGNELISWYCKFPFPSPALVAGTTAVTGKYTGYAIPTAASGTTNSVSNQRYEAAKITSVAGSPLCHVSVSTWCKATEAIKKLTQYTPDALASAKVNDSAKGDRCARLTADVAAKAATILNQHLTGRYRSSAVATIETNTCMTCHASANVPKDSADYSRAANDTVQKNAKPYKTMGSADPVPGDVDPSGYGLKDDEQGKMPCVECHVDETAHQATHNVASNPTVDRCDTCHTY